MGFVLAACNSKSRSRRPMYIRDRKLSAWNPALPYHGSGERYLFYEVHPSIGGRWAITDDQDWSGYNDRSYAFIVGEAPHPGYLEDQQWCIYRDAKYRGQREWISHESLR